MKDQVPIVWIVPRRNWLGRQLDRLAARGYKALGSEWCGNTCVPCNYRETLFGSERRGAKDMYRAYTTNDAYELVIHYRESDRAILMLWREEVGQLVWWVVVRWWLLGEWGGLRRWLWYKALSRKCSSYPRIKPTEEAPR